MGLKTIRRGLLVQTITIHHTEHFSTGFIGDPLGQLNTAAKSSELERVPITLKII